LNKVSSATLLGLILSFGACAGRNINVLLPGGKVATLSQPIEIEDLLYYKDGGTTAFTIKGRNGNAIRFSLLAAGARQLLKGIDKPRSCVGADFPDRPGATLLYPGGAEERSIAAVLRVWADSQASRERQRALYLGGTVLGLSEREIRLFRVLRVKGTLEVPVIHF